MNPWLLFRKHITWNLLSVWHHHFRFSIKEKEIFCSETNVTVTYSTCGFLSPTFELCNRLRLNGHDPVELNVRHTQHTASSEVPLNCATNLYLKFWEHMHPPKIPWWKYLYRAAAIQTALSRNQLDKKDCCKELLEKGLIFYWDLSGSVL